MLFEKNISGNTFQVLTLFTKLSNYFSSIRVSLLYKTIESKVMSKKVSKKDEKIQTLQLGIIRPNVAGLDVGSMNMMLSYPGASGVQTVEEFDAYTDDLNAMAKKLVEAGVTDVGMEATGVYWIAVFEVLEQHGIKVTLVNARHYKNVSGQKTDVKDAQWLQQLHAHGLLRGSHVADEQYRELRTYIHYDVFKIPA